MDHSGSWIYAVFKRHVVFNEGVCPKSRIIHATTVDMDAYTASRNKITKMVSKQVPQETESLDLSVQKSVLIILSGSGQSKWSMLSMFSQTSRVHSDVEEETSDKDMCTLNIPKSRKSMDSLTIKNMSKKSKASETMIQEVEEGFESLYKNLMKTRVSLLNVLSQ